MPTQASIDQIYDIAEEFMKSTARHKKTPITKQPLKWRYEGDRIATVQFLGMKYTLDFYQDALHVQVRDKTVKKFTITQATTGRALLGMVLSWIAKVEKQAA